jgi:hypothetical protein
MRGSESLASISVAGMATLDELSERFREFSATSTHSRAPLYSRIASAIADDHDMLRVLQAAPETQQLPVLLFASVHHLLLSGLGPRLASHYPNLSDSPVDDDPVGAFHDFVAAHTGELTTLVSTRHTQTNEVGRCAQFVPPMGMVAAEVGTLAHVDVGTSAGLNLLLPTFSYEFAPGGRLGPESPVRVHCETRGPVPVPAAMPHIARSIGLDLMPIDVRDDTEVRWLEACVWPDQADRFARLVAAIELARLAPPDVRKGDAVKDLAAVVREAAEHGHPVVTNSWVLNYLPHDTRLEYVAELERLGSEMDISWVIAEAPGQTVGLPVPTTEPPEEITVVTLVRWRGGLRTVQRLGTTHPHGYWLRWEPVDA